MRAFGRALVSLAFVFVTPAVALAGDYPDVDLQRAEEISSGTCALCHGADGESSTPLYPRLAGQHYRYVAKQLADFQSGRRVSGTMAGMVEGLTPEEMLALGVYFEKKSTKGQRVRDPELAEVGRFIYHRGNEYSGVASCASCHGAAAHGSPQLPRLASQGARYTEMQLKQFNERERTNDNAIMHSIASRLTELEIKAVSMYLSSLD